MPNATYRPPSTKAIPPVPPEFVSVVEKGGWEMMERVYGGRTDLHLKWIAMSGAKVRMPKRSRRRVTGGMRRPDSGMGVS